MIRLIHFLVYPKILMGLLLSVASFYAIGQDIHFSQFMNSPMTLNPAQTGNFKGSYRFVSNYRRQWSSVTIPYQTLGVSADANDFCRLKNFGTGISIYYDKTGDSHFSTLFADLSASYRIYLNKTKPEFLTVGIQGGLRQRRIDYSNLTFDNQYNGYYYDPDVPSIETFNNTGRTYADFNTGIQYTKYFRKRKLVSGGVALFNIAHPDQSFFGNSQIRLDKRLGINLTGQYPVGDKWDLLPGTSFMIQGTYKEFIIGSSLRYTLTDTRREYKAISIGAWGRAKDAGILSMGINYDEWYGGISYDFNLSKLQRASYGRGGFEFSLIYIVPPCLPKRIKYKVCPEFI